MGGAGGTGPGAGSRAGSWYEATANPAPVRPALDGDARADAVVVGGGYTGLSAALCLAERGFDVALLEARRVGWGASGRNGGQIVAGYNRSIREVAALVGAADARRLWELEREARRLLADRVARHAIACDLRWGYVLAALKPRHMAALRATADEWAEFGHEGMRLLERDALREAVDSPRYIGGLFDPASGQLHPLNYALGLADAAARAGVRIFEATPVVRLDGAENGSREVAAATPRGTVRASFAVLAGNAYLPPLSPDVDGAVRARTLPAETYMLATEPLGDDLARAVLPGDVAVADLRWVLNYFRLSPDRRLLFGGGVSYSSVRRPGQAEALRRTMAHVFPRLRAVRATHFWSGRVALTRNRLPHLGRVGGRVYFAHGYSGHGVALSGLAGALIAEAAAGTAERFDVFTKLPHRAFPGGRHLRVPLLVTAMTWFRLRDLL